MEFLKNINEINESMTDGKDNYELLKKIFNETTESQIVMLDACGTFYFCNIELLGDVYQLYPYVLNELTGELSKNNNPIMRINKTHTELIDDIIDMNNKEKFYTFTIITSTVLVSARQIKKDETVIVRKLTSVEDYLTENERRSMRKKHKTVRRYDPNFQSKQVDQIDENIQVRRVTI